MPPADDPSGGWLEAAALRLRPPAVPAAFFGVVLGLAGLGSAWRAVWRLPALVGEWIMVLAVLAWAVVGALYLLKWVAMRDAALAELEHPIHCCFVGLAGVATMLAAGAIAPWSRALALALYAPGLLCTIGFAVWRTGMLWRGGRDPATTTAVLYLPTVAGSFVAASVGSALGHADAGGFLIGMGGFAWLAIESVLLHRLLTAPELASGLRPTLGIQLAPPVVGAVALTWVAPGAAALLVHGLIGYGILQALILVRLMPWILKEPFAPSYWAFTFGATALAVAPLRLIAAGDEGAIRYLAPPLFVFANLVVLGVAAGSILRIVQGRLIPAPVAAPSS